MKRDKSLHPLSWQHHDTLMACLMIKKGVNKQTSLPVLQAFTKHLWENELNHHFNVEENKLIPWLRQKNFPEYLIKSLINDHNLLRTLHLRLQNGGASHKLFLAFSELLEQHVRFEERLIFEKVQDTMPLQELESISNQFATAHSSSCKTYPVKFWE